MTRSVPVECVVLLQEFEQGPHGGFAAWPYRDPTGNLTDGWGHLITPHEPKKTYPLTKAQADTQALADLTAAAQELTLELGASTVDHLTVGQYGALLDFVFNEGIGHFATSTMCHLIKTGQMHAVVTEFPKWVYGKVDGKDVVLKGQVTRRAAEQKLWLS